MTNTEKVAIRVSLEESTASAGTLSGASVDVPAQVGIANLVETLKALGMVAELDQETAELRIAFPSAAEASRLRNRGGGRPRKRDELQSAEFFDTHTVQEGMRILGVSKATYYRRAREARARAAK